MGYDQIDVVGAGLHYNLVRGQRHDVETLLALQLGVTHNLPVPSGLHVFLAIALQWFWLSQPCVGYLVISPHCCTAHQAVQVHLRWALCICSFCQLVGLGVGSVVEMSWHSMLQTALPCRWYVNALLPLARTSWGAAGAQAGVLQV